ncbi:hypothetical protein D3C81_1907440 [compost metagenome]
MGFTFNDADIGFRMPFRDLNHGVTEVGYSNQSRITSGIVPFDCHIGSDINGRAGSGKSTSAEVSQTLNENILLALDCDVRQVSVLPPVRLFDPKLAYIIRREFPHHDGLLDHSLKI